MSARLPIALTLAVFAVPAIAAAQVPFKPSPPPPPPPVFETKSTHVVETVHKPVASVADRSASAKNEPPTGDLKSVLRQIDADMRAVTGKGAPAEDGPEPKAEVAAAGGHGPAAASPERSERPRPASRAVPAARTPTPAPSDAAESSVRVRLQWRVGLAWPTEIAPVTGASDRVELSWK